MQYRLKEAIDAFGQKKAELVKFVRDNFASGARSTTKK